MEETFMLISLVTVMLIGSFLAGNIPLFFIFSENIGQCMNCCKHLLLKSESKIAQESSDQLPKPCIKK